MPPSVSITSHPVFGVVVEPGAGLLVPEHVLDVVVQRLGLLVVGGRLLAVTEQRVELGEQSAVQVEQRVQVHRYDEAGLQVLQRGCGGTDAGVREGQA